MSFDEGGGSTKGSVVVHHKLVETWLSRDRRKLETETHRAILSTGFLATLISAVSLWAWQSDARLSSLAMIRDAVTEQGEWWRLWSMMLVHADVAHWASNMPLMILFGYWLTQYFGLRLFPLLAFAAAGLAHALVLPSYAGDAQVIGASGLVYLMGGTWLSLQFFIQRQFRMGGRLLRVLGVMALLFLPQEYRPHVAERVHMAGLGMGLLLGTSWFLLFRKKFRAAEVWQEIRDESHELDELADSIGAEPGLSAEQIRERLTRPPND